MTDPARWKVLESLFGRAAELPAEERAAWLEDACGGDALLRAEVEAMLAADSAGAPLEAVVREAAESFLATAEDSMGGRRVGAYRIVRELGRGGMGRVYLAERDDAQYAARVAVKLVAGPAAAPGLAERFATERQVLADLRHPGIARLLDAGVTGEGEPWLAMEYVDGKPIDTFCEVRRLTVEERVALVRRLCDAVEHAHRRLVVHRDIKASNVLVTEEGEPRLLNFGIAKLLDSERARALELYRTGDASRVLTPATASPEQLRGEPVTTATDVYALGHLLYGLLTGRTPYAAAETDPFALPRAIVEDEPVRPSIAVRRTSGRPKASPSREAVAAALRTTPERLARRLAGDLDAIVLRALRKEPDRRYATPAQLAEDLGRHLEGRPVLARGESIPYLAGRLLRRHRRAALSAAAAVALLVGLVSFYTTRLAAERDRARVEARRAEEVAAFVTRLFEVATPDESRGAEITALEVLDEGARRIETELAGEPAVQASLMRVIGSAYGKLGQYGPATALLERALETREALAGPPDVVLGEALHERLGAVLLAQARYPEADSLLLRALEARRAARGPVHGEVAATLRALATLERERADFEAAERYLDDAQAVLAAVDPPDSVELADLLLARADLYGRLGDAERAIPLHRRAVEIRTLTSGPDHPATLIARNNLANVLSDAGRTAEAEELLRGILAVRRRVLPAGHPGIGYALSNLASTLKRQGRSAEAAPLQSEALALFRAAYPGDHPVTALALNNLANLHHDLRDLEGAWALHQEALAMKRRLYGDDHPALADSYNNLAALELDREDYEGALELYRRTLDLDLRTLGEDHPYVGHDLTSIGSTLGILGRLDEAAEALREAVARSRRTTGPEHPQTANALRELGVVLRRQGRCAEADGMFAEALPLLVAAYPGEPWEVASARVQRGACLTRLGRVAEAEPFLVAGYERLRALRGDQDRMVRDAAALLAAFLRETGRGADAERLLELHAAGPP